MLHLLVAPLVIGAVIVGCGLAQIVFRHQLVNRFPEVQLRGTDRRIRSTPARSTVWGSITVVVGILIVARGGLGLF